EARKANIGITVEFMPYSQVRDLSSALRLLDRAGAPNAGVCLDVLHLHRSGGSVADLAHIDRRRIALVQLCDAQRRELPMSDAELMAEARTGRLPAGEGELPLFDFLDALPEDVEIEYELAPASRAALSPLEKARAAR